MAFPGARPEGDRVRVPFSDGGGCRSAYHARKPGRDGSKHMTAMLDDDIAELRRTNAELQRSLNGALAERDEVEAQKAALAEVLEVINSSPGDLAPVFDAMLEKALDICDAAFGILQTYDGTYIQTVAH